MTKISPSIPDMMKTKVQHLMKLEVENEKLEHEKAQLKAECERLKARVEELEENREGYLIKIDELNRMADKILNRYIDGDYIKGVEAENAQSKKDYDALYLANAKAQTELLHYKNGTHQESR